MSKKILVWFRNDLRLHDNEMLVEAIAKSDEILPVYCFIPVILNSPITIASKPVQKERNSWSKV